ncbi:hypothetical protein F5Y12DRAFT_720130 [Xylaria sp. FL1777]|nr:hypothetical protein F5Y12DRAFT_720130 [Xylaria sp. FL1777]
MATLQKPPHERFDDLTTVVGHLETGFSTNFAELDKKKYANAEEFFLSTYSGIVDTMQLVTNEKWKDDVDENLKDGLDALFSRLLALLPKSVEHIRKTDGSLTQVHKGLLEAMLRLSERPDCTADGLMVHIVKMASQLNRIRPPPRGAWNADGSDLNPNDEFEEIFEEFSRLEKDPENKQMQHELYAIGSYRLLRSALRALHLPEEYANPGEEFFYNKTRPSYVEYPYGSDEFFYGKGRRPGVISIKSRLGSPLTDAQQASLDEVAQKAADEEVKQESKNTKEKSFANKRKQATKKTWKKQKEQKEKENTKGTKREKEQKRHSKVGKYHGSKKPRTKWGYTMTSVNAAADVEDILRDSKYTDLGEEGDVDRPDSDRLVTPTVEIRKTTLVAYRNDLRSIIDEIYKRRFGTPTNKAKRPQTPNERKAWLERATRELKWARANVHKLIETATTPAKSKQLRLAAYKLKLVRSMYTLGLLSGEPSASLQEIRDGLKGRLDDWILYEEAWNVSELITLERQNITQELWDTITAQIDDRANNITRWREMKEELDGEKPASSKRTKPTEQDSVFGDSDELESSSSEEQEEDDGEDEDEDENDDGEVEKEKRKLKQEKNEVQEVVLTDEEIANGRIILNAVLHPKLPDSGNYLLDPREERRRRKWFKEMAIAKLAGKPTPPWTHKAPFDPFAAGGPPGWEKLPLETVWDRLQYMWVLTYWRFFQLRELEP